jgi:NitT/TauT family transport system ATP-binding protein
MHTATYTPHLQVQNVSKTFQTRQRAVTALDGIDLRLELNELVCIVGASGSGKSTLLRIIAGLLAPTSGVVQVDGVPVTGPGADRGVVFQDYTLYPWLTVEQNVAFGLKMRGVGARERREQAQHYLGIVGLDHVARQLPHTLSGGMQQRVAIARALANRPALLLMDEPFGALDTQTRELMQEFLRTVWRETATSILLITHDIEEAIFLAQRLYVLTSNPGRVKAEVAVPLPAERDFTLKRQPTFLSLKDEVSDLLREETLKSF